MAVLIGEDTVNDVLTGGVNNDTLLGGGGADRLEGKAGDDVLDGETGNDQLLGDAGDDSIVGGSGDDLLDGSFGNDTLIGGDGDDGFNDKDGSNVLSGGAGADYFFAYTETGESLVTGGAESDTYDVFWGGTVFYYRVMDFVAGAGGDLIAVERILANSAQSGGYTGGNPFAAGLGYLQLVQSDAHTLLQWDLDGVQGGAHGWRTVLELRDLDKNTLTSDNFVAGMAPDGSSTSGLVFNGSDVADDYDGGLLDDTLLGGGGADRLEGKAGDDVLDGETGNDQLLGDAGDDSIVGGSGDDLLDGSFGNDTLIGGDGDDGFNDKDGSNVLSGGAGADYFFAYTETGESLVTGGAESDTYDVFWGGTVFYYRVMDFVAGAGGDLIAVERILANSAQSGGYTGGNPFAAGLGYLQLVQSDAHTLLQWDLDGVQGGAHGWRTVLELRDLDKNTLT